MMIEVVTLKLFIDKLTEKIKEADSRVCVGLDPHLNLIPSFLFEKASKKYNNEEKVNGYAVLEFNKKIIDNIYDLAAVVKPQIAFYEKMGIEGLKCLQKTISYAKDKGLIVLLDAKRNDIGSTAEAYASAYLDNKNIDAITVNPYLGYDGIKPFLKRKEKGTFALLRTSNKSAGDIQDIRLETGKMLYEEVGSLIKKWGQKVKGQSSYSNLGAVIGATYPDELKKLRSQLPNTFFLIPGFGAQGGGVKDIISGFDENGFGAIVNSARGILFSYRNYEKYSEREFAVAARETTKKMKDDINYYLNQK